MDVLLIDSDSLRRVGVARHLANAGHRVTISSSIDETRDILQFVSDTSAAPGVVVITEILLMAAKTDFRNEVTDRFRGMLWFALQTDPNLGWLTARLLKESSLRAAGRRGPSSRHESLQAG